MRQDPRVELVGIIHICVRPFHCEDVLCIAVSGVLCSLFQVVHSVEKLCRLAAVAADELISCALACLDGLVAGYGSLVPFLSIILMWEEQLAILVFEAGEVAVAVKEW